MVKYQYHIGGSLPINDPTYISRSADQELYQSLKNGEFCYIFNARHTGKSSLKLQIKQRLQAEGIKCVAIDLTTIGTSDLTVDEWYAGIIDQMVMGLELYHHFDVESWWQENQRLSNVHRLTKFFDEILLNLIHENIVILIDEIDSILSLDFKVEDFFTTMRDCYNKRVHKIEYQRLTFALFGVVSPTDLIKDKKRTPFTIGKFIDLKGFTLTEATPLLEGLKPHFTHPEKFLQSIIFWTGGQPFLSQKLCFLVSQFAPNFHQETAGEFVEKIVRSQIIKNWQTQDEPEHLKIICDSLLFNEKTVNKLLKLYQEILELGYVPFHQSFEQIELLLSGLVILQNNQLMINNPIYLAIFNHEWIRQELENLRPYSQSIIAWLASNRLDNSRLLRGQALQDALNWSKDKNLSYQDYQFLTASQEYDLEEARQILELKKKALEADQLKLEAQQNQKNLDITIKENKILHQIQQQSQKKIKIRTIALITSVVSAIPMGSFLISGKKEEFLLKIEQNVNQAQEKFEFAQLDSLIVAMEAGQDFQQNYHNKINFGNKEPIHTPMFILRSILDQIQEKNQLTSHEGSITAIDISPNGQYLVSGSSDHSVKLWNLEKSQYLNLKDHQAEVTSVKFSPDGQYIATGSVDRTVKIWNLQGNLLKNITQYQAGITSLSFSPDGQYLATVSLDNLIKIWDLQGNLYQSFNAHEGMINAVTFSPDSKYLATASDDTTVMIWNLQGNLMKTFKQDHPIFDVKFSPDGSKIATASNHDATVWDLKGYKIITLKGHNAPIRSLDFSPDGSKIATASEDLTTKIWNLQGQLLTDLKGHQDQVLAVVFSPNGQLLATGSKDRTIRIWTLETADRSLVLRGHEQGVTSVNLSPDGQTIATTSSDRTLRLWDLKAHQTRKLTHPDGVTSMVFTPDGQLFLSACEDGVVRLWNKEGQMLKEFKGHKSGILSLKISADGQKILSTSRDQTAILWTIQGTILQQLQGHEDGVLSGDFSPKGDYIVTSSDDGTIRLWDQEGKFLKLLAKNNFIINSLQFSPLGKIMVTGASDGKIRFFNLDGKIIKEFEAHHSPIQSISMSPDGNMIASGSFDGTVRLWNLNGDGLGELRGHQAQVTKVIFSPTYSEEKPYILSASGDKTARMWQVENLEQLLNRGCLWLDDYVANHPLSQLKNLCNQTFDK